jgi:glycosyltransferase involved in cell wall biosynthesis
MTPAVRPTLICFAGDSWDGNPHSRHHLARRFAQHMDVLFVESVPMRSVTRGDRHEWRRVLAKLGRRSSLRTIAPGLHVLRPFPIPPAGALGRRAQLINLRLQVRRACSSLGLGDTRIAWFSLPVAAPLRGRLGEDLDVLYYQDRYDQFTHVDAERLRAQTAQLARECHLAIATSTPLAEDLRAMGAKPMLAPHGVDIEHFATAGAPPTDLAGLERPLVGYVGLIDDHMDFVAVLQVADRLVEGTVVMVGASNVDTTHLRHPRIVLLGHRPYEQIPAYIAAFDSCLIPFAVNELTLGVNPIKLREYLAAGRPVVSTALPELLPYAAAVELVHEGEDFAAAVLRTLVEDYDSPALRKQRRELVAQESWDRVAAQIEQWMMATLACGSSTAGAADPV